MEDENIKQKEDEDYIIFKLNTKQFFKVYRNRYNGKDFFKVMISQKKYDGTEERFYKQVTFGNGVKMPENGDIIRIKKGIENVYVNRKDPTNTISCVRINDYELKENKNLKINEAYSQYNQSLNENSEENISISDDMLPF